MGKKGIDVWNDPMQVLQLLEEVNVLNQQIVFHVANDVVVLRLLDSAS